MALLSIIVPVYNKERYIDECIQSILNQTFKDFELILVNDGSTDKSGEKCREYEQKDDRVIFIDQKNGGVSSARNAGLKKASGSYIGFIDSDDTIEPDMYELLINNALANNADISVCRMRVVFPGKTVTPPQNDDAIIYNHNDGLAACLKGDLDRSANNKIYRSEIGKLIRFEGHIYEDILYICKAFLKANTTVAVNAVKYNYLVRDNSVSMSSFNPRYVETIDVSNKIVQLVSAHDAECLPEAHAFDIITNISLLNLLLLAEKDKYMSTYIRVVDRLNNYKPVIYKTTGLRKKHRYAFKAFSFSPKLYTWLMYAYCLATQAEVIKRTKKVATV